MADIAFEWDPKKWSQNLSKHGISFDEARTVFADEHGLLLDDPDHSYSEPRFILLGMSAQLRLLVVSHTTKDDGRILRIISARKATKQERRQYGAKVRL